MSFQLDVFRNGETLFIKVAGRVVLDECERFKAACVPYVQQGVTKVAVDMSEVDFIDSAGLGVLVGLKMTCNKVKAKMSIVSPSQGVADILYVSKLDGIFNVMTGTPAEVMRSEVCQPEYRVGPGGAPAGGVAPLQPAAPPQPATPSMGGGAPNPAPAAPPQPQNPTPQPAQPAPQAPRMSPPNIAPPPSGGGGGAPGSIAPMRAPSGVHQAPGSIAPMGGSTRQQQAVSPSGGGFDDSMFAPPIGDPSLLGDDSGFGGDLPDLLGGENGGMPPMGGSDEMPAEVGPVGFMDDMPMGDDMPDLLSAPMPDLESATIDEALGTPPFGMSAGGSSAPPSSSPRPASPAPGSGSHAPMISPINGTLDDIPMLRESTITPIGTPVGPSSGESNAKTPKEMVELHCQRAFEHMRQGAYEDSIREYKRALEYNPDYLPALNNLAIVFEKKPSWHQQAIEQWERVHQLSKMKGDQKHIDRAQKHLASLRKMQ